METRGLKILSGVAALVVCCVGFAGMAAAQDPVPLPTINVTASRVGGGIVGASNTVITAEDIARSPSESLQDLIAREAGVQTWSTFGGVNGVGTTVDLRGFGATAASNTLVLINGRRVTDVDLGGVDFSLLPRDSIERIEITRGNSGAVLYGDGAVGGVINIITKSAVGAPPAARIEGGFGSFNQREGSASLSGSNGPFSVAAYGQTVQSNGYRVNNALNEGSGVGDFRVAGDEGSAYLNVSGDNQQLGLPGARRVTLSSNQLVTDRTGATTPTAFADKQGFNMSGGVTRTVADGMELILDGGVRQKQQQLASSLFGFDSSDARTLTTSSFTPRFISHRDLVGLPSTVTAGLDVYDSQLDDARGSHLTDAPVHRYNLEQRAVGVYWQQTIGILESTDVSYGGRLQQTTVTARDIFDATAPGGAFDAGAVPLDSKEAQYAAHVGVEHRFSQSFAVFGRAAHSFRTPTVDERVGVLAFPVDFNLKTQTSQDVEGGFRIHQGPFDWQTSAYDMELTNELLFIPFPPIGANINLDPTRRYGVENTARFTVSPTFRLNGSASYTRAVFREGPFAGNDVPLVATWTGSIGASWDVWQKWLTVDTVTRFVGPRRMDNDQANFQPMIPAHAVVDLRFGGVVEKFFWSLAIQNLLDADYFDYAVASSATFGTYNAYPMPGRTFMGRAGVTF